jgi:hypothetical protein
MCWHLCLWTGIKRIFWKMSWRQGKMYLSYISDHFHDNVVLSEVINRHRGVHEFNPVSFAFELVCHSGVEHQLISICFLCIPYTENTGWMKNAWPDLQNVNLHHNIRTNIMWTEHGFWVMTFWILTKNMLRVSICMFKAGHCRSEQWLPYPLENSKSQANCLKSIVYLFLQILDVADCCSIKSRLRGPWDKNLSDLEQRNKQAMLLLHLIVSIVLETRHLRILELQEESVIEHHQVWTVNEFQSAEQHLQTN